MNETGGREPNGYEHDKQLCESDRVARFDDVEILQDVWNVHET